MYWILNSSHNDKCNVWKKVGFNMIFCGLHSSCYISRDKRWLWWPLKRCTYCKNCNIGRNFSSTKKDLTLNVELCAVNTNMSQVLGNRCFTVWILFLGYTLKNIYAKQHLDQLQLSNCVSMYSCRWWGERQLKTIQIRPKINQHWNLWQWPQMSFLSVYR